MDAENLKSEWEYHAGQMYFGRVDIKAVREIVNYLEQQGIYHDEFIGIEYPSSESAADYIPALEVLLKKLNITIPDNKNDATRAIARWHLLRISKGKIDPTEGVRKMRSDIPDIIHEKAHGLMDLMGAYWNWDDMTQGPRATWQFSDQEIEAQKKEIVDEARKWLATDNSRHA